SLSISHYDDPTVSLSCLYSSHSSLISFFFFFNDTATTEIYTLSLHDALPICSEAGGADCGSRPDARRDQPDRKVRAVRESEACRSEEHTSELQSLAYLVCRLLLEKKKKK